MENAALLTIKNFNTGFVSYTTDVIIHLSQWQFWFWFWFGIFWSIFFLLLIKVFFYQNTKLHPRQNTSLRGYGKWGDFIASLLPLVWCSGILINSNFILRTLEWQHENTLFTLRIHGRQWYWIYKYDMRGVADVFNTKANVGRGLVYTLKASGDLDFLAKTVMPFYAVFFTKNSDYYWSQNNSKNLTNLKYMLADVAPAVNSTFLADYPTDAELKHCASALHYATGSLLDTVSATTPTYSRNAAGLDVLENIWDVKWSIRKSVQKLPILLSENTEVMSPSMETASSRSFSDVFLPYFALLQYVFYMYTPGVEEITPFERFANLDITTTETPQSKLDAKTIDNRFFYIMKQRRSKKVLSYKWKSCALPKSWQLNALVETRPDYVSLVQDPTINKPLSGTYCPQKTRKKLKLVGINDVEEAVSPFINTTKPKFVNTNYLFGRYKAKRSQLRRNETFFLALSKRLLRTRRMLILPTNLNIALVTNSYDVAHSWFIPALGLKFDCVPGRSTHHTLHIAQAGSYYGQCAEVCGRYHHHMPIRVGALAYEHFISWWKLKNINVLAKMLGQNFGADTAKISNYYFSCVFNLLE